MANYSDWYEKNKNNPFVYLIDGIFDNLIFLPIAPNRILGLVRFFVFLSLMWFDPFDLNLKDTFWIIPYGIICLVEMGISIPQMYGIYWGNPDEYFENPIIEETPSIAESSYGSMKKYPNIQRWFVLRDFYMGSMPGEEKAKFFVETGALTEQSIQEMERYPNTKRALERLDFELGSRNPKEKVEFLRGYRS